MRAQWVCLLAAPWTIVRQAPLPIGISRQDVGFPGNCSGLPFPSPGYLPNPGMKATFPLSPALQVISSLLSHQGSLKLSPKLRTPCY